MADLADKLFEEIEKQAKTPEQAERLKEVFGSMAKTPLPTLEKPVGINMHAFTVAVCAAAFCVGKEPMSVPISKIRTNAVSIANNLFHEDGTFIG